MSFLDFLGDIYCVAFSVYIIYLVIRYILSFIIIPKTSQYIEKTHAKSSFDDTYANIRTMFGLISLIIVAILLAANSNYSWVLLIIIMPWYIKFFGGVYASTRIIKNIIRSPKGTETNLLEKSAILFVGTFLFYFENLDLWSKLFSWMDSSITGAALDILKCVIMVFICFYNVFFISILFTIPGIFILKSVEKFIRFLSAHISVWCRKMIAKEDKAIVSNKSLFSLLTRNIKTKRLNNDKAQICLRSILIPFIIIVDLMYAFISTLFSMLVIAPFSYTLVFIRLLKNTFLDFCSWLCSRSDRIIIAFSFRLSIIAAFVFIVITNRITPIFTNNEAYTTILEFVSSAIIIPVIFDGISAMKDGRKGKKDSDK